MGQALWLLNTLNVGSSPTTISVYTKPPQVIETPGPHIDPHIGPHTCVCVRAHAQPHVYLHSTIIPCLKIRA